MTKIVIVGTEGCGKTVLIAALARRFGGSRSGKAFLEPMTRATARYVHEISEILDSGEWPPSTPPGQFRELHWQLHGHNSILGDVEIIDPAGQDFRLLFSEERIKDRTNLPTALADLANRISRADIVALLVNLSDFIGEGDGQRRLDNQWAIKYALDVIRETGHCSFACLVLTQTDLHPVIDETEKVGLDAVSRRWDAIVQKYLPIVYKSHVGPGQVGIKAVSSVTDTRVVIDGNAGPRRVPKPASESSGLDELMNWFIDSAQKVAQRKPVLAVVSKNPSPPAEGNPQTGSSNEGSIPMVLKILKIAAIGLFGWLFAFPFLGWLTNRPMPSITRSTWKPDPGLIDDGIKVQIEVANSGAAGRVVVVASVVENGGVADSQQRELLLGRGETRKLEIPLDVYSVKSQLKVNTDVHVP